MIFGVMLNAYWLYTAASMFLLMEAAIVYYVVSIEYFDLIETGLILLVYCTLLYNVHSKEYRDK